MVEPIEDANEVCPNCGASENERDARFCQTCGSKLGSMLIPLPPPPLPSEGGNIIASRFTLEALLWTAPTYNAYSASSSASGDAAASNYTVIEQRLPPDDTQAGLSEISGSIRGQVSGSLEGNHTNRKKGFLFDRD